MVDTPNDDSVVDEPTGQTPLGEPSEELLTKTADRLSAFRGTLTGREAEDAVQPEDDEPKDGKPAGDEPEGDEPKGDKPDGGEPEGDGEPQGDEPKDDEPKGDEEPEGGGDDDKPKEADADKGSAPFLPESYRRSLHAHAQWTDEEIDKAFEAMPEKFLEIAGSIHQTRNTETARFAELGRKAREAATKPPEVLQPADPATPPAVGPEGLKLIDPDVLIERFGGNEELVTGLVGPVNDTIRQINAVLPELRTSVQAVRQSRQDTLATQIEKFFTAESMAAFGDFYGNAGETPLTAEQQGSRGKVLEMADAIVAGATMQGRQMSVDEALLAAHDSVASDQVATQVRAKIKKATKKRAKSVTLRPGGSGKSKTDSKPSTRGELERKARAGLKNVFG